MSSKHLLFKLMYRLGFTPWDEHPLATSLRNLVEGDDALPTGTALDIGCGTGDSSIYLAQHGWRVTGVDFVPKALDKARAKATAKQVAVDFVHADATRLSSEGVGKDFTLIVDDGEGHGHVVYGECLPDKVFELIRGRNRHARSGFDGGEGYLSQPRVGHPHHAGVAHGGV